MNVSLPTNINTAVWLLGVPALHGVLVVLFRTMKLWPEKTLAGSRASDMMASIIIQGTCCTYLGIQGTIGWLGLSATDVANLSSTDFYGKSQFVEDRLLIPMIGYQLWNFFLCFCIKDLTDIKMMGHHFATAMLGYFALHPYLHYYALYFFGLSEIINTPLTILDIFKYFPQYEKISPIFNLLLKGFFVVSYFLFRVFFWTYYSYEFWIGSIDLLVSNNAHSPFVVIFILVSNLFLTGLQFYWGFLILKLLRSEVGKKEK